LPEIAEQIQFRALFLSPETSCTSNVFVNLLSSASYFHGDCFLLVGHGYGYWCEYWVFRTFLFRFPKCCRLPFFPEGNDYH